MSIPGTTRLPNLGHTVLLLAFAFFSLVAAEAIVLAVAHPHPLTLGLTNQKLQLLANALTYLLALAACWLAFPLLWHRPFLTGLRWNARRATPWLVLLGLLLGFASQAISSLLPVPKKMPIEDLIRNPALIWLLVIFGTLVAPIFEEILFRGFLLPGFAIAIDYLRLPRHPVTLQALATLDAWRQSEVFSTPALVLSSLLTSLLFALIHAPQLGMSWPAVTLLAAVSLALCAVRLRTHSVAASTLVHACYNLSVFVSLFIATGGFRHLERI